MLELQHLTWLETFGRLGQTEPIALRNGLQHKQFNSTASGTPRLQPGLEHPRVVHHQQILGLELLMEIPHREVPAAVVGLKIHR
jgi:hypothetical protein